jgi:histone H3/H4
MGIIIKSNIKKQSNMSVSEEFLDELEKVVQDILRKAEDRARGNFRRTLFARDL